MFGNFEMDMQTAQHIAGNKSDRFQLVIILIMLASTLVALLIHTNTALGIIGSITIGVGLCAIITVGYSIRRTQRKIAAAALLRELQKEQLKQHRSQAS